MTWQPQLTRDEFIEWYLAPMSDAAAERVLIQRDAYPCGCGDPLCLGWMMVSSEWFAKDLASWEAGTGPHPSKITREEWEEYVREGQG